MNKVDIAWTKVVLEWTEMFGEPPPVRTSPQVARRVLRAVAAERAEREASHRASANAPESMVAAFQSA